MLKTSWSAFLSLLLVFLSGALVGGFASRLLTVNSVISGPPTATKRPDPEEVRKRLVTEMKNRVKLDDQQVTELQKIFDDTRENFDKFNEKRNAEARALRDNQTDRIKAMLHADQLPLFDQLRTEHEQERKRRHPDQKK
jgi:uncharacterized protein YeaO (DUF488 family)